MTDFVAKFGRDDLKHWASEFAWKSAKERVAQRTVYGWGATSPRPAFR